MIDEYKLRYTKTFNLLYTFKEDLTSNSHWNIKNIFRKRKKLNVKFTFSCNRRHLFLAFSIPSRSPISRDKVATEFPSDTLFPSPSTPVTHPISVIEEERRNLRKDNLKSLMQTENPNAGNELFLAYDESKANIPVYLGISKFVVLA